jgi:hypothetical protein
MPSRVTSDAAHPLRQLWRALRGRDSVLHDRILSITSVGRQASRDVGARLACFAVGLGLTIIVGLAGTMILQPEPDAPVLVRHLWGAIGAWLGVIATVAVTRSELRAAVLLMVAATLGSVAAIATSLPAIVARFAPGGNLEYGGYFAIGTALGIALGARAAIAYRRSPAVTARSLRDAIRGTVIMVAVIATATGTIYWLSQRTAPNAPDSNAIITGVLGAVAIGVAYHFVAPPPPDTTMAAAFKRILPRMAPIALAGPIAAWVIPRSTGDHALPRWVDGLLIGCFAGVFAGYVVDLLERPFAGRRQGTAMMTVVTVVIVPALRLLAFDHTSVPGMDVAQVGAVLGLVLGGATAFIAVRPPDHDVTEPDEDCLEPIRHVVLLVTASPPGLPVLSVDLEGQAIRKALAASRHAQAFELQVLLATAFVDLCDAIAQLAPTVVHFIGHGDEDRLYFHGAGDLPEPVPIAAIVSEFEKARSPVKVVVINACRSARLAGYLAAVVDYAIGMTAKIDDRSAVAFADGFYRALGDGRIISDAYFLGKNAIRARELPHVDVPCEKTRDPGHLGNIALVPIR